jgi:hypothetical protein
MRVLRVGDFDVEDEKVKGRRGVEGGGKSSVRNVIY